MRNIEAVLFDLDGTLLDRAKSLIDFARWQAKGMFATDIRASEHFVRRFIEIDANGAVWKDRVYAQLIEEFSLTRFTVNDLLTSYEENFYRFCQGRDGATAIVNDLVKAGKKLAVVSNGKSPFQETNLRALNIADLFDVVIISGAVGVEKPDPAIFKLACEELGIQPQQAAFVGDNPVSDIDGANSAGMFSIYVPEHYGTTCNQANAECHNLYDLPSLLRIA